MVAMVKLIDYFIYDVLNHMKFIIWVYFFILGFSFIFNMFHHLTY